MAIDELRKLTLEGPLAKDALLIRHMEGTETLGVGFEYVLTLYSEDSEIKAEDLLGQHVTVKVAIGKQPSRLFDGIACEFGAIGFSKRHTTYRMVLRPWLWLLSRNRTCRIYQRQTVPDILRDVFGRCDLKDMSTKLMGTYREREYCVQYNESDLRFVNRLMQEEGIYYFFQHGLKQHTLVLADSPFAHEAVQGIETLHYNREDGQIEDNTPMIHSWASAKRLLPGKVAHSAYDYTQPNASLEVESVDPEAQTMSEAEIYDHSTSYNTVEHGEERSKLHIEEQRSGYDTGGGTTNAIALHAGALFTLADAPRKLDNRKYLVTSLSFAADSGGFESGGAAPHFSSAIRAIESSVPFRTSRTTPRPVIPGAQTAMVVGPKKHEIHTDEHGRIRVQFHWDRYGTSDENSSCWIRVAQTWAGASWGSQFIPRIGQEVVVEFLDGNPDWPLVTGCVYNGSNKPPFTLPKHATQSGIRSKSSQNGGAEDHNELRFEDRKGQEQLFMQAQRNMDVHVKKDASLQVGGSRSKTVTGAETNTVKGGRTTTIERNDDLIVKDATRTTQVDRQYNITAKEQFQVVQKKTQLMLHDMVHIESDGDIQLANDGVQYWGAEDGTLMVRATRNIEITCGPATISLSKDGTIKITGTSVEVGTKVNNTKYEPPGITVSGSKISQTAVGIHEIAGALIKVG